MIYKNKKDFIWYEYKHILYDKGCVKFWILNDEFNEIYEFDSNMISDYDVSILLVNGLTREHIISITLNIHNKKSILTLVSEIPGNIYLKQFDCYRELFKIITEHQTQENLDKIYFIEDKFPEFII